jgi:TonB family protein
MKRIRCLAVLACVVGLGLTAAVHAAAIVRIRATSINDLLRDLEILTTSTQRAFDRDQVLQQLAASLGVADLSFLDLTRPVVIAMPDEGRALSGAKGFVLAVPVRDGAAAIDAVAHWFAERTVEGGLTVLRPAKTPDAEGATRPTLYAVVRRRMLIVGPTPECVRELDPVAVASGDDLPPGALTLSLEVEPLHDELQTGLAAAREQMKHLTAPMPQAPDPGESEPTAEALAPIEVTAGVTPPQLRDKITPRYPEQARLARTEGRVILRAVIDENGNVRDISVLRSSDPVFDDAAIEAVERWKYAPAVQDGRPVSVYFTVIVEFKLHDPKGPMPVEEAGAAPQAAPFDPRKLEPLFDLYFDFLRDTIDSVSKLQISIEVKDGFVIVHGRGTERPGSTLAGFITAQQDAGLPAIGRMMPAHAPILVAGRLDWTEPSRAWLKGFLQGYRTALQSLLRAAAPSEPEQEAMLMQHMDLWTSDEIIGCQRGDFAYAMDRLAGDMQMLQAWGVSSAERCGGALASLIARAKSSSGGKALVEKEVLEPEMVPTWVYRFRLPTPFGGEGAPTSTEMTVRFAEVGDMVISGTDEWAAKAIREAAQAREGSVPGRGGLLLADLGPLTPRPGVFGRMQLGTMMRQEIEKAQGTTDANRLPAKLIEALEGPAGAIPFAMHFDDGAAMLEFAVPLALLETFAEHAPEPQEEPEGDPDDDEE